MKMSEKLQEIKKDNKGFSLVELIIVIAIMAILIGIVGMNVIPQIENARKATDAQVLSAFVSEAMEAWTQANQASGTVKYQFTVAEDGKITFPNATGEATSANYKFITKFKELELGSEKVTTTTSSREMKSKAGKKVGTITIECSEANGVVLGTETTGVMGPLTGFEEYEFESR